MTRKPDDTTETGYRRPPAAHRFQPGVSGNPAGRPKKSPSARDLIEREARRSVKLKTSDGVVSVPKIEAVIRRLYVMAMEGNLAAMRLILQYGDPTPGEESDPDAAEPIDPANVSDEAFRRMLRRFDSVVAKDETA